MLQQKSKILHAAIRPKAAKLINFLKVGNNENKDSLLGNVCQNLSFYFTVLANETSILIIIDYTYVVCTELDTNEAT